jgi:arylsulfatase A-like enzyme
VLNAIADSQEADSTYVMFMSDNGMMLGEHRYPGAKDLPYEPTSRLPFAIRGAGLPVGTKVDELAGTMDVAPDDLGSSWCQRGRSARRPPTAACR